MPSVVHNGSRHFHDDSRRRARGPKAFAVHLGFKGQLVAWGIALGLYTLVVPTDLAPPAIARAINDIAWTLSAGLAMLNCARAARIQTGRDRIAWLLFAAACASWLLGQLIWNFQEIFLKAFPVPGFADIGYLGFAPLMIAGLFALRSTQQERGWTWLRVANLSLVLCALAIVLIAMLSQPFLRVPAGGMISFVVVAESALTTIAFIVAIYFLWSYHWGSRSLSAALITAGLAIQMIAGLFYTRALVTAEYGATSFFNIGWIIGFAAQQWAAIVLIEGKDDTLPSVRTLASHGWIEALAPSFLVLCIGITSFALAEEITPRIIYFGASIVILFAVLLAVREGWLYGQGLKQQLQLERTGAKLAHARAQLKAMNVRRDELERNIQLTTRAGAVGLWDWDIRTDQVRYSPEWKRQLGYGEGEIEDTAVEWRSRIHPEDVPRMTQGLERFLEQPTGQLSQEIRLRHRNGSYRWILTQASASLDAAGRPIRMLGSHVDITPLKELELSLRDSERRYRELIESLEERVKERTSELTEAFRESQSFAHAVAHDLKAPLRAIDGFSALLQESAAPRLNDTELQYVARVRRGAVQMAALIDGLLAYSRLEHCEIRIKSVDCRTLVEELLSGMSDAMEEAQAELVNSVESTAVLADPEGLRIVLRNVLDNALKFSRASRPPRIEVSSKSGAGDFVLCVRDNGIGFDPQYQDKIFEIFNRLHATGYEGTGMGLALARKAVQRMNGKIWAESSPGQGAAFFVSLPQPRKPEI